MYGFCSAQCLCTHCHIFFSLVLVQIGLTELTLSFIWSKWSLFARLFLGSHWLLLSSTGALRLRKAHRGRNYPVHAFTASGCVRACAFDTSSVPKGKTLWHSLAVMFVPLALSALTLPCNDTGARLLLKKAVAWYGRGLRKNLKNCLPYCCFLKLSSA